MSENTDLQKQAQQLWESMGKRLKGCQELAKNYILENKRQLSYRVDYEFSRMDNGSISESSSRYCPLTEEECQNIKEKKYTSFTDLPIDWRDYICPPCILTGSSEYDHIDIEQKLKILNIDLNDQRSYCIFDLYSFTSKGEMLEIITYETHISDEDYVQLLTYKLFDENLTFYDLRYLSPQLYDQLSEAIMRPHMHQAIVMTEIDEVAKKIHNEDPNKKSPSIVRRREIQGVVDYISEHTEEFNDEELVQAIAVFNYIEY